MKVLALALCAAAALAAAPTGDTSVIELRSSPGLPIATISYDGETLTVPQHCRQSTCNDLNLHRAQQIVANQDFADTIQGVSDHASRNTNAVETLSKATLASFDESARKIQLWYFGEVKGVWEVVECDE